MQNEFIINSNGEFEYRNQIGEEVRKMGKDQSVKELVYQPDGTFALLEQGDSSRGGENITSIAKSVWY